MVGREARAKRATTAFNGGKIFFGLEKKKSVAVLLFSTFGKVSNMPAQIHSHYFSKQQSLKGVACTGAPDDPILRTSCLLSAVVVLRFFFFFLDFWDTNYVNLITCKHLKADAGTVPPLSTKAVP